MQRILSSRRSYGALLAFLWLAGIIVLFYASHKPFSPVELISLLVAAWRLVVALALVSLAGGLGRRLLPLADNAPLIRLSLQAALGLGLLGLVIFLVAASLGLRLPVTLAALALLMLLAGRQVGGWWKDLRHLGDLWREADGLGRWLAVGCGLLVGLSLLSALAPPIKFDALVYHLALPRIYLDAGRFVYVPEIMFWGMPQTGEMLYTWAMQLGGNSAALTLGWAAGVLALVGLVGYVAEGWGARPAWVSAASLLCGFTLATALAWGYVDWFAILFGWAGMVTLDRWLAGEDGHKDRRGLWLAGVFAGLALATKYTAGVLLLAGMVSIAWRSGRKLGWKSALGTLFQYGLAATLVCLPWLVKNAVATGNPAYPFGFPAGAMDALRLAWYQADLPWGDWRETILLPVRATWMGFEGAPGYSATIGPLLLGLGAAAGLGWLLFSERARASIANAALLALPTLLIWMVGGRLAYYLLQSRLYFVIYPALAVLAGAGFAGLDCVTFGSGSSQVRLGRIAGFLVALVLGLNLFQVFTHTVERDPLGYLLAVRTEDQYLSNVLGWTYPALQAVNDLPEGTKTLMLWETRSLYCTPRCVPDEVLDRWLQARYSGVGDTPREADAIRQLWQQAGFTHLLYHRMGADFQRAEDVRMQAEDWQALDDLLAGLPEPVSFGDAYELYSLQP